MASPFVIKIGVRPHSSLIIHRYNFLLIISLKHIPDIYSTTEKNCWGKSGWIVSWWLSSNSVLVHQLICWWVPPINLFEQKNWRIRCQFIFSLLWTTQPMVCWSLKSPSFFFFLVFRLVSMHYGQYVTRQSYCRDPPSWASIGVPKTLTNSSLVVGLTQALRNGPNLSWTFDPPPPCHPHSNFHDS
jgi:hypothetical protein